MQLIRTSSHALVPTDVRWVNLIFVKDDNLAVPGASVHANSLGRTLRRGGVMPAKRCLRCYSGWCGVWQDFTVPAHDAGQLAVTR